jgi:threonine synthase
MRYISTRGEAKALDFAGVLLAGLASDGGLFVPATWPKLPTAKLAAFAGRAYPQVAAEVMQPFVGTSIRPAVFRRLVAEAAATFDHASVAPLRELGPNLWLMELFHGPTLAFKDVALQLLARLFDQALGRHGRRATIVGATSGDTGAAAIAACRGRGNLDIFILHPAGRVSDAQRRQMTTVTDANVHNLAIKGSFDDCQALVKALFGDPALRAERQLVAINSINWARVMAQIVYYVTAAVALGAPRRAVSFAVPTGNFGDVYAGYAASRMGLPVERLIVATNRNDILARFFATGEYRSRKVMPTSSPSMDIQVASNFERLLFDLCGRDGRATAALMAEFAAQGRFRLGGKPLAAARRLFQGARVSEAQTRAEIARCYRETGIVIDPHTAVALAAARRHADPATPTVVLATAHPAKFPQAIQRAIGKAPEIPPALEAALGGAERCAHLDADFAAVRAYIKQRSRS